MNKKRTTVISILFSIMTMLAFCMKLCKYDYEGNSLLRLVQSMRVGFSMQNVVLFAGLYCIFCQLLKDIEEHRICTNCRGRLKSGKIYALILGSFFGLCMVVGKSILDTGTIETLYHGRLQVLKTILVFGGYTVFFYTIILYLFYQSTEMEAMIYGGHVVKSETIREKVFNYFQENPFHCAFMILSISYLPYIVLSYPVILQGDAADIIAQGFNLANGQTDLLVLLDETVFLNAHHPIAYTLLVHIFLKIGKILFDSYNVGIFLLSMTQLLFAIAVISYMISYLTYIGMNIKISCLILIYYIFSPKISAYMFLMSKEVFYSYALLGLLIYTLKLLMINNLKDISNIKSILTLTAFGLVIVFFRNEGKYIIILWFLLVICIFKSCRKIYTTVLAILVFSSLFISDIIMPYYKITPGSIREMLSIPFQQTARYVKMHPDDVTDYEKEVIDQILGYDTLAERYVAERSDAVKDKYNKYATTEDLKKYFKVWLNMMKKDTMLYVDATLNNYYNYFYPSHQLAYNYSYEWSETCMELANNRAEEVGMDLSYPKSLKILRNGYEILREYFFSIPILNTIRCASFYVWTLLFLAIYFIWKRNVKMFCVIVPLLLSLGTSLLGPCNGYYYRYIHVIAVALPFVIVRGLKSDTEGNQQNHRKR